MLAILTGQPFSGPEWLFEPKLDGFRVIAFVGQGQVALLSGNGIDMTGRYPAVANDVQSQLGDELVLDGEIVALNEQGLPDFGLLQRSNREKPSITLDLGTPGITIVYYPFDLLYLNGRSLQRVPLVERKDLLARAVPKQERVQLVEYVEDEGERFFAAAVQTGFEGMVGKAPGQHLPTW